MDSLKVFEQASRIVIKIGSTLLVDRDKSQVRVEWLESLAAEINDLVGQGKQITIVSSGSIALGRLLLSFAERQLSLEHTQAAAACGQIRLARTYEELLQPYGIRTAQVLLTLDDSDSRRRYLNARATMTTLLNLGVIPIINENDTVATDEIRFGDNDRLAAQVAIMIGADVLVLFSDIDGLYDRDPRVFADARRVGTVNAVDASVFAMAGQTGSELASGGMKTKLMAAKTATEAGCAMVIANGFHLNPIANLLSDSHHTWFKPQTSPRIARKHWIASLKPKGQIMIDAGAKEALQRGKSLLPAGVMKVVGDFGRGDAVEIIASKSEQLGSGLIRYTSNESRQIMGHKSHEINDILGFPGRSALIHKDDMSV